MYHYKAFNLHFITPFECPELIEINENNALEKIKVNYSKLPQNLDKNLVNEDRYYQSNENEYLLNIKDIARFLIKNGNEILIEEKENLPIETLRLYLFGSAIGALLHQRKAFPFHASAIVTSKGIILFCGDSGAGKSTTLQAFLKKGYKKISDDTISMFYDENKKQIMCVPSYPQSKIWQNTADIFNHDTNNLRQMHKDFKKFALPTHDKFEDKILPLHAIYELNIHEEDDLKIEKISSNTDKLNTIIYNTYRYYYLDKLPQRKNHFDLSLKIVKNVDIYKLLRPKDKNSLDEIIKNIENNILISDNFK
ncbi:MAG: hypothetical protein U5K55_01215 [Aliarcobacter sp.]|nr:hypothetical protein [Aliarcobacter sp.]